MPSTNTIDTQALEASNLQDSTKIHAPPPGTVFNEADQQLWNYLMGSRLYRRWTHADLFLAVRVVRIDSRLRKGYESLDDMIAEGQDIFDPEHEASRYYDNILKAEKHMLSTLRMLGLTRSPTPTPDPERNLAQQKVQQFNEAVEEISGQVPVGEPANKKQAPGFLALT